MQYGVKFVALFCRSKSSQSKVINQQIIPFNFGNGLYVKSFHSTNKGNLYVYTTVCELLI